ncbi:kinase-like protein [Xylariaceae sp. FL0016]|nr:kinase-like protein [Xylariaceae sp. FL0016]
MDYMPGGDFLGLLIRENILNEPVAKFYIAEMILCIEEAHALCCIHRDIKPDNFLVSASGHLKISDFGLAFDGHWSHDTNYYHTQRYSVLHKLGITVEGDATDRAEGLQGTMKWAQGVSQAMHMHERQLPAWSLGVILYECLYGHTPFISEEGGRQQTKRNIMNHKQTFAFPQRPVVSKRCMDLMASLICAKEDRLSSKRYRYRELHPDPSSSPGRARERRRYQDWTGRSVYPYDGEDIRAHKWFRGIAWEQLHLSPPPFVPQLNSLEDTHYFDEEDPISDWSESAPDTQSGSEPLDLALTNPLTGFQAPDAFLPTGLNLSTNDRSPQKLAAIQAQLSSFPRHTRGMMAQFIGTPFDSVKLKRMDREIEALTHHDAQLAQQMKLYVRTYGRRERKRPRDRLLRDRNTKGIVLEVRKQTAFLGYTFRRNSRGDGIAVANNVIGTYQGMERWL